ncbi:MAG: protein kinase domain-containing protein [Thermoleophilaceae bacterium]
MQRGARAAGSGRREPNPRSISTPVIDSHSPTERRSREAPTAAVGAEDRVLDRYRLERPLGRGGHGTVWEALDERLERLVAVKVIAHGDGSLGPRAEREGRVAARLSHPGIVGLYELGSDDEAVYLVSELVRGRTMAELAAAGGLSDRDVCGIGIALCSALGHAHAQGVIHRDVKPQNVIVAAEPAAGAGFAKLTDFGVAHVAGEETLTRTGDVVGTFAYMAPEQAEGRRVSTAADVYSLALTLHEGWSGTGAAGSPAARLGGRPIASLERLRRDLPPELCRAVDAALDPRPELRPSLGRLEAELHAADRALSEEGGLVEPATRRRVGIPSAEVFGRPRPRRARGWLQRAGAGLAAAVLIAAALQLLGAPRFPIPALGVAGGAAALVALLPRIGWMLTAGAVVLWLASPMAGLQGTALVLAVAIAPVPLLLPRAGLLWSVPALAPLLGALGLAPMFVAVAGLAATAWRRAALAALGLAWLAAAEVLTGRALLFGAVEETARAAAWEDSALTAARDAIYPTLVSPLAAVAGVWAALAVGLGLVVRGRAVPLDLVGAIAWAIALVAAHEWLGRLLAGDLARSDARGLAAGAVVGAAAAVAAAAGGERRHAWERPSFP